MVAGSSCVVPPLNWIEPLLPRFNGPVVTTMPPPPNWSVSLAGIVNELESVSVELVAAEIVAELPSEIVPAYVFVPMRLTSAPAGLAERPAPLSVRLIFPLLTVWPNVIELPLLFWRTKTPPEKTVAPLEFPVAVPLVSTSWPLSTSVGPP